MPDLIPADPQQLAQGSAASQQPSPPQVAADALGTARSAPATSAPLIADVGLDETVAGQLRNLISEDSPVLQQARARSQQFAAGRGLQNSSIAAQAGEQAVVSTATPIAAADAATVANRRSQNLSTVNQFGLNEQQHQQQRTLISDQTNASSRLQEEQGQITARLQAMAADQELTRLREQGTINERLTLLDQNFRGIQADLDRGAALDLEDRRFQNNQLLVISEYAQRAGLSAQEANQELDRLNQAHLNTLDQIRAQADAQGAASAADVGPRLQAQYLSAVNDRMMAASSEIQQIYTTQGLKPEQQTTAVNSANARLRSDLAQLQAYYRQSPLWDDSWGASTPSAGVPATSAPVGQVQVPTTPTTPAGRSAIDLQRGRR